MEDKLKILSKGRSGKLLLEVCEDIKRQVADIRTDIPVKSEIANEVRLGVIGVIDKFIVERIKILSGVVGPQDSNEFL